MEALAWIGGFTVFVIANVVGYVACDLASECIRAYRQSIKIARYTLGKGWRERVTWRDMWRVWKTQVLVRGSFDIGFIRFPYDPRKPYQRAVRWDREWEMHVDR